MTDIAYNPVRAEEQSFLVRVFTWLALGLGISAVAAYVAGTSERGVEFFEGGGLWVLGLILAPIAILLLLSFTIARLPVAAAYGVYLVFCIVDGLGLGIVFLVYTTESIVQTFAVAAAMFAVMAGWGYVTKRDLSSLGSLLLTGLWGLLIAMLVNLVWANSTLYWITTFAGVAIFLGLTAYDMQKIKRRNELGNAGSDADKKEAIWGALDLYLDLVNLFLFLLRILGRRH